MKSWVMMGLVTLLQMNSGWAQSNSGVFEPGQIMRCTSPVTGGKTAVINILLQSQLDDPEACGGYCNPYVPFEFHRDIKTRVGGSTLQIQFSVVPGQYGKPWNGRLDQIFVTVSPYGGPRDRNGRVISFEEARNGFVVGTAENGIPCRLIVDDSN